MKYYIVYSHRISFQPDSAHEIHDVMCAYAMKNLGYPTALVYPELSKSANLLNCLFPFQPQSPSSEFIDFFNVDNDFKVVLLPIPKFVKKSIIKKINLSNLIYKYYLPFQILPQAKIIHTRDWNCVKVAVKSKVPTVFERHYFQKDQFEPEIVNNPYFKIAITQSEPIRQSLIQAGMPPEKVVWIHNGFSPVFLERQPQEAQAWRDQLLQNNRQYLVVYSGALYRFKGIDLLIDVAKKLPQIQFVLSGGTPEQVQEYTQLAAKKQVENIKFLGWILPRSRLVSLLQAADILAHPHCSGKSANFTNPVKFFQYMASGTPIVATKIPPLLSFQSSPLVALWSEPDNPTLFAEYIEKTLQTYPRKSKGYRENMEFSRQFSWEERGKKIISYIIDESKR